MVYDQDDFPPERFDNTSYAADKLSKTGDIQYKTAWSNQCIEYWFLLHFENLQADIDREQYKKKLSQHLRRHGLGEYRKNLTNLFSLLKQYGNLELAIRFAENRLKEFGKQKPSMQRPATKVHELVVDLLKYIPK
ncbi:RloB family protein [Sporomusa termitida]|uniref:RloB-like protein n=1 Tax=Sporomusa termitida TaxID=2377 RepID=A0A517DQ74_9FIRM|nr:RloB family protein [Sporomusa termitida]QDR79509.1 RloB-like protein [Sporomusa termitida]